MRRASGRRTAQVAGVLVLALVGVSCGSDDGGEAADSPADSPASPTATKDGSGTAPTSEATTSEASEPDGTAITTAASDYGEVLWGPGRQVVYIWEQEPSSTPECYGDCAVAWPPVLTEGEPVAEGQVDAGLLGTTERRDGSTQVTYNGHPLYYYAHEGPGEVECHNVATHGGLWWVITPDGERAA
nr:hypothetical protein [Nocardioides thalensis]